MTTDPLQTSTPQRWTGRILSGLVIVFLFLDASVKLVPIQPVIETMQSLGFVSTPALARTLGALLLVSTLLYAIPRTALFGAVLLTGYLGGAIATQVSGFGGRYGVVVGHGREQILRLVLHVQRRR